MSGVYKKFRASIGRDGADYSVLDNLGTEERDALGKQLLANLDSTNALALGYLGVAEAADALELEVRSGKRDIRLEAARGLWDLSRSSEALAVMCSAVRDTQSGWTARMSAIGLLRGIEEPAAFDALEQAMFDPEFLVRRAAAVVFAENSTRGTTEATIAKKLREPDVDRISKFVLLLRRRI